ncbi:hypothetical protein L150_00745 [Candida albicans Ca529L]|nr:hypothetical protein L150_00745 [Candida albicans Ca529L]
MVVSYSVLMRLIKLCKKIVVKENRFSKNLSAGKVLKNLLRKIILYDNNYFRTLRKLHKLISVSLTNLLCIFGLGYTTLISVSVSRDFFHTKSCTIPTRVLLSPHSREYLRQRRKRYYYTHFPSPARPSLTLSSLIPDPTLMQV